MKNIRLLVADLLSLWIGKIHVQKFFARKLKIQTESTSPVGSKLCALELTKYYSTIRLSLPTGFRFTGMCKTH